MHASYGFLNDYYLFVSVWNDHEAFENLRYIVKEEIFVKKFIVIVITSAQQSKLESIDNLLDMFGRSLCLPCIRWL